MDELTGTILVAILAVIVSTAIELRDRRRGLDPKSLGAMRGVLMVVSVGLAVLLSAVDVPAPAIVGAVGVVWVVIRVYGAGLLGVRRRASQKSS